MSSRTPRNVIVLAAIVSGAGSAACAGSGDSAPTVQRTDSAGVQIVTASGVDRRLEWKFERVRTISSDDEGGAGVFDPNPAGIRSDSAGRLYVLDYRGARVIVFDERGRFMRSLGRRGGGPGEVAYPLSFDVTPNGTVAIFDVGKRKLVRFAADGSVLPELALGSGFFGGYFVVTRDGYIYDYQGEGAGGARVSGLYQKSEKQSSLVAQVAQATTKAYQLESCGMGFRGLPPIFHPTVRWTARDQRIALAQDASYDIRVLDQDRDVMRLRREVRARAATAELAEQQLGEGMKVRTDGGVRTCRADEVAQKQGFAPFIPLIGSLAYAPNGELWVQRGGVKGEDSPTDVFGADGAYLGTLPAAMPFPAVFLPGERIAVVERDDLDVGRITVYHLQR